MTVAAYVMLQALRRHVSGHHGCPECDVAEGRYCEPIKPLAEAFYEARQGEVKGATDPAPAR